MILPSLLAVLIGLLLGLLGGGGSILTVPMLVYIAELPVKTAIVMSLIIVGLTSAIAVIQHARQRRVCWKTGCVFGAAGMVGAYAGGRLAGFFMDGLLMLCFAFVMWGAALAMLFKRAEREPARQAGESFCPADLPWFSVLFDGFGVGLITGLVGVGGGFLLVPALNLLTGLPMFAAVGTSLMIISFQSLAALAGHAQHMTVDWGLTATLTGLTILGSLGGSFLATKISAAGLKKGFGVLTLLLSGVVAYQELNAALLAELRDFFHQHQTFISGALTALVVMGVYRLWLWLHARNY